MQDKQVSNEVGTSSATCDGKMVYPRWLTEIFILLTASYGQLWTDQFLDDAVNEAIKRLWYFQLKEFDQQMIRDAILQFSRISKYPPKPAELIEILESLRRDEKERQRENLQCLEGNKIFTKQSTHQSLQAWSKIWKLLGRQQKAEEVEQKLNEISQKGESDEQK